MNVIFYLLFNFILYSFIGWIIEGLYSFTVTKKFKKEGFLIGPFKPMYGIAFTYLILCNQILKIEGIPLVLLCFLIPTTIEYISGCILKYIFDKTYWDYSNLKHNIHGFVTLKFSIYWTVLSLIGISFLQTIVYSIYIGAEEVMIAAVYVLSIVLLLDLVLTLQHLKGNIFLKEQVRD